MNCVTPLAERGNGEEGEKLSLEVLVLYDGLETGLRARQILDQTLQQLEPTADMQVNFWRVDLFGEPAFLEQVAR